MPISQLIRQLEQKVDQFCQEYTEQRQQKITVKFDRTLFSENYQTVDFYLQEIQQTLLQIQRLQSNAIQQYQFLSEKLLAQCRVLREGLIVKIYRPSNSNPVLAKNKTQHAIHRLPPRERLEKYYEAFQQLTEKYNQAKDYLKQAQTPEQQITYQGWVDKLKARRAKCLESIELLEEYLAFCAERETKSQINGSVS